jgi:hypothetical protein
MLTLKHYGPAQNYACTPCASIDQGQQRATRAGPPTVAKRAGFSYEGVQRLVVSSKKQSAGSLARVRARR